MCSTALTNSAPGTIESTILWRMRCIEQGPVYSSVLACAGSSIVVPYLFGSVSISDTRCTHSRVAAVNSSMHPGSLLFATVICPSHFLTVSPYSIDLIRHSMADQRDQARPILIHAKSSAGLFSFEHVASSVLENCTISPSVNSTSRISTRPLGIPSRYSS